MKYRKNKTASSISKVQLSTVGILCTVVLGFPASAIADTDRFLNIGLEGGISTPIENSEYGGHISIRSSLVNVLWRGGRDKLVPKNWQGGYVRAEWRPQSYRAILGYGHSALFTETGLEYGLILGTGQANNFAYGGEVSLYVTRGLAALYIRESAVMDDELQWQTDVGLRVQFPIRVD